jgi:RHS repeat-associated protein
MTDASGQQVGTTVKYLPFGGTRSGSVPTDKLFTGQRLDATGLYYYNARYYDALIGRFISPDTVIQSMANPQTLNRYSYVLNNPLKYSDPSGRSVTINGKDYQTLIDAYAKGDYYALFGDGRNVGLLEDPLVQAFNLFSATAPMMAQGLLDSVLAFNISWGYLPDGTLGDTSAHKGTEINVPVTNVTTTISDALSSEGISGLAFAMALELGHDYHYAIRASTHTPTLYEESLCDKLAYKVAQANGYDPTGLTNYFYRRAEKCMKIDYSQDNKSLSHDLNNILGNDYFGQSTFPIGPFEAQAISILQVMIDAIS